MALSHPELYRHVIFPALRQLSEGDHEKAHTIARRSLARLQRVPGLLNAVAWCSRAGWYNKPVDFCGVELKSPVGFAAGLDKNAEFLLFLQACGFGFGVTGTVLPYEQAGNPRPRLFRLMQEEALINRLGFNSDGILEVRRNLQKSLPRLRIPIGISLGKMKGTPPEEAYLDYVSVLESSSPFGAFLVVNVSSPNTPGLRDLQGKRYIEGLVRAIAHAEENAAQRERRKLRPVLVKIAPDLTEQKADEALEGSLAGGAAGFVIGNTTVSRPFLGALPKYANETGGLSGKPLFPLMIEVARYVRTHVPNVPLMLAGGINSDDRAKEALEIGTAIKIHTPFVFGGPRTVAKLKSAVYR